MDSKPEWLRGDWMQTYTGRRFYPMNPRPEDICIEDIAHSLSNLCRYAGHCQRFYSVAEHCVHIASGVWSDKRMRRNALLHDAAEAYLVDIPRPLKRFLPEYKQIELGVEVAIAEKFDLYWPIKQPCIDSLDTRILHDEQAALMLPIDESWNVPGGPLGIDIKAMAPEFAESEFLEIFAECAP